MGSRSADDRLLRQRAAAQLLADRPARSVAEVVRRVVGIQAQDVRAARLAVRARSTGLTAADVRTATAGGELVCTWLMRGTLHQVLAQDVRWLLRLFGDRNVRADRGRRQRLRLDQDTCDRALDELRSILGGREPLGRDELVAWLARRGIDLDPRSQAPAHLLMYAGAQGVVCRGPETDADEPTYTLLDDVLHGVPERVEDSDQDLARLATRYLTGYGPATPEDLGRWSGLPVGTARAAFDLAGSVSVPSAGRASGRVRLLGHFDCYLLGYASRVPAVPAEHDRKLQSGGGFVMPAVQVDGRVVATWRSHRSAAGLTVETIPFTGQLAPPVRHRLADEIADLGRFFGLDARLAGASSS